MNKRNIEEAPWQRLSGTPHKVGRPRAWVTLIPKAFNKSGVLYKLHRHASCLSTASLSGSQHEGGGVVVAFK